MKATLIFFLGFIALNPCKANNTQIVESQALQVELFDAKSEAQNLSVRVRDVDTNKMVQLVLRKKANDPHTWEGLFKIQFYKSQSNARVLEFMSVEKFVYFASVVRDGVSQKINLYTSVQDQEKMSQEKTKNEGQNNSGRSADNSKLAEVYPSNALVTPSQIDPAVLAAQEASKLKLAKELELKLKKEALELESKKRQEALEAAARMSEAEKAKKKERAQKLALQANAYYKMGDYQKAESLYSQSTEIDPENQTYLYQYGVSLYKIGNYDKSLLNLSIAEVPENLILERDFYVALNKIKLKDAEGALKNLIEIRDENDSTLSPRASFMAGSIEYQSQKFSEARKSMEYVIDHSKEPEMDRAAEEMLEQIDNMENFIASKKEKYRFTVFAGPIYDQNVLNMATNNIATDVAAIRANYGLSALGIWHRTMTSDLGTQISMSDYYSTTTSFKPDTTLQAADALQYEITVPFHTQFAAASRSFSLEVLPTGKSIYLSTSGGARTEIIRSVGGSITSSGVMKKDLYLTTKLDFFNDTSFLTAASSDDVQSGSKYSVTISPTKMLDMKGEHTLSSDFSYLANNSDGKNYRYTKYSFGVSYGLPALYKGTASLRLDYSTQSYAEATTPRTDTSIGLTSSYSKELAKNLTLSSTIQYTMAHSDLALYNYNKLMLMGLFTYSFSVSDK